ncbi:unnamed protein product [Adineta steineri]|uniref:Uncharacterized protein n=1 Tax=Adineta steineri TaxID=433720 RepID=A0A814XRI9_9BILA|nr:unnamed protein product [Adineta steineri]CAF1305153.1 unnamed protein product [Adineta steineri]CAF3664888.1 unnamed protein product [Adineta steineri]CAF3959625.1 unnamed protein product [Adineta steineri]
MSDHSKTEGHWESHSYSSKTTKIGDNPAVVTGKEADAEGAFDHGKPVVTESHATSFSNVGHPNKIDYKDESSGNHKSIK